MSRFFEITHYEFSMFIRRPGFWIAYGLLTLFYFVSIVLPSTSTSLEVVPPEQVMYSAGHTVFMFNIFLPLLAGILSADRMQRDFHSGISELQQSTSLSRSAYILGKFLGALFATLLPMFVLIFAVGAYSVITGIAPVEMLWALLLAFLSIAVPSHAFVIAFSLACPLIMPLRVYQVLFTGYWFWGNMLSPQAFPTISNTLLNAIGQYPLQAYFSVYTDSTQLVAQGYTPTQATLNLMVLIACITAALTVTNMYLRRQARQAQC